MTSSESIDAIKIVHAVVWAFFVSCILAIWVFAWQADYVHAALSIGVVMVEVVMLVLNRWRCPLTSVAARYTDDRRANFDVYLPEWLARYTKLIFGALYVAGIIFTLARWAYLST
jgi:riboflavin transporter FmnP